MTTYQTWGTTGLLNRTTLQTNAERWYLFDAQGNVAERTDATGAVLSTDRYDAWGHREDGGDPTDPVGYGGQYGYYTDPETGLLLCTWRYYDPDMGRWLTQDPIGYAGGLNLYRYCGDNPLNLIDPLGTCGFWGGLGNRLRNTTSRLRYWYMDEGCGGGSDWVD